MRDDQDIPPKTLVMTGASGFLGSALAPVLESRGIRVTRLPRISKRGPPSQRAWDPEKGVFPAPALEGVEGVIHLAGEGLDALRWTRAKKNRLRDSRVVGTRALCETLARVKHPPRVLLSASAIGYYGDRGDECLTEESAPGSGFFPELCRAWESATQPAAERGIRVVCLRLGLVLSPKGGALARMLPLFRLGLGGRLGSGRQFMSWITLEDALSVMVHALNTEALRGPVNVVAPQAVTQSEWARTLGRVLKRPAVVKVPAPVLKLVLGEMAGPLLLASARVEPRKLAAGGFVFRFPELEPALRHLLGPVEATAEKPPAV